MKIILRHRWKLFGLFASGMLLSLYLYVNNSVSYKYEVDHMQTIIETDTTLSASEKNAQLEKVAIRNSQIQQDFIIMKNALIISAIGLVFSIILLYKYKVS